MAVCISSNFIFMNDINEMARKIKRCSPEIPVIAGGMLVKKVLHGPISFIKNGGGEPSAEQLQAIDLINKMFLSAGENTHKEP